MIKHTDPYSVSQIFSNDKNIYYTIPKYQREYTWGSREWELLFNDVVSNDNGYFLGSIICVDTSVSSLGDTTLEVIDGQQRLTSLSILLATICKMIEDRKAELDEYRLNDLFNLKKELVLRRDGRFNARVTPQIQNYNRDDYFSLLCDLNLLQNYERKPYAPRRKIYRAHYHFEKYINNHSDNTELTKGEYVY